MTAAQDDLVRRLRTLLDDEPVKREVAMFGGRSFMVNDKMVCSAMKDGGLLVRAPADRHEDLLAVPGASQAEMGAGRSMGPGWIAVAADSITSDNGLHFWVAVAMEFNRAVTAEGL